MEVQHGRHHMIVGWTSPIVYSSSQLWAPIFMYCGLFYGMVIACFLKIYVPFNCDCVGFNNAGVNLAQH